MLKWTCPSPSLEVFHCPFLRYQGINMKPGTIQSRISLDPIALQTGLAMYWSQKSFFLPSPTALLKLKSTDIWWYSVLHNPKCVYWQEVYLVSSRRRKFLFILYIYCLPGRDTEGERQAEKDWESLNQSWVFFFLISFSEISICRLQSDTERACKFRSMMHTARLYVFKNTCKNVLHHVNGI